LALCAKLLGVRLFNQHVLFPVRSHISEVVRHNEADQAAIKFRLDCLSELSNLV